MTLTVSCAQKLASERCKTGQWPRIASAMSACSSGAPARIQPVSDASSSSPPAMLDLLRTDYQAMAVMIFGDVPSFDSVIAGIAALEMAINR